MFFLQSDIISRFLYFVFVLVALPGIHGWWDAALYSFLTILMFQKEAFLFLFLQVSMKNWVNDHQLCLFSVDDKKKSEILFILRRSNVLNFTNTYTNILTFFKSFYITVRC
jgi:hypothetical protein